MSKNDAFLAIYREYEQLLKARGTDIPSVENSLEASKEMEDKLRISRQMRNFMSHNDDPNFLNASDAQINFFNNLVYEERLKTECAKDHMRGVKSSAVTAKDKCSETLDKMIRLKVDRIVVDTGGDFGVASIYDVAKAVQQTKTSKMSGIKLSSDYAEVYEETSMQELRRYGKKTFIVKKRSNKAEEKVVGVVYL